MEGGVAILLLLVIAAVFVGVGIMLSVSARAGSHGPDGDLNDASGRPSRPTHHEVHNDEEPRSA